MTLGGADADIVGPILNTALIRVAMSYLGHTVLIGPILASETKIN